MIVRTLERALAFTAMILLGGPYLGMLALASAGDYFSRRRYGLHKKQGC